MKRYSKELKEQVFIEYLCGAASTELAAKFNVPVNTIYKWMNDWQAALAGKTLADCPVQTLGQVVIAMEENKRKLDEVTQTLAIIHESGVIRAIPQRQRFKMAEKLSTSYPKSALCSAFELKPSTFYYYKQTENKHYQRKRFLCNAIRDVFESSGGRFGSERIRVQLRAQGIKTSKKTIIRLMKEMGLNRTTTPVRYYTFTESTDSQEECSVKIL